MIYFIIFLLLFIAIVIAFVTKTYHWMVNQPKYIKSIAYQVQDVPIHTLYDQILYSDALPTHSLYRNQFTNPKVIPYDYLDFMKNEKAMEIGKKLLSDGYIKVWETQDIDQPVKRVHLQIKVLKNEKAIFTII